MLAQTKPAPTGGDLYQRVTNTPKPASGTAAFLPRIVSKEMYLGSPNGALFGWADFLLHVGMWVAVLTFDILIFDQADKWNKPVVNATDGTTTAAMDTVTFPYALAGLILSWVSFGFILAVLAFHLCSGNKITTELAPFLLALIMGSIKASLLMTIIYTLFTTTPATHQDEWKVTPASFVSSSHATVSAVAHRSHRRILLYRRPGQSSCSWEKRSSSASSTTT
jgi:hypothetical protein